MVSQGGRTNQKQSGQKCESAGGGARLWKSAMRVVLVGGRFGLFEPTEGRFRSFVFHRWPGDCGNWACVRRLCWPLKSGRQGSAPNFTILTLNAKTACLWHAVSVSNHWKSAISGITYGVSCCSFFSEPKGPVLRGQPVPVLLLLPALRGCGAG